MTKELLLRLTDEIHEIIQEHKDISGVSKTQFIYNAIYWYLVSRNMISFEYIRGEKK